jgi:hypothetical protein
MLKPLFDPDLRLASIPIGVLLSDNPLAFLDLRSRVANASIQLPHRTSEEILGSSAWGLWSWAYSVL